VFDLLDGILLAAVVLFGVSGYRQGFVVGALSFIGFLGGGVLGAKIAAPFSRMIGADGNGPLTGIVVVFVLACIGQIGATAVGAALRRRLTWRPLQQVDNLVGAVVSGISVLLVAWLLGTAVHRSPYDGLASQVRNSQILMTVDSLVPDSTRSWFSDFRQLVDANGFPEVFSGLSGERIVPVDPPDAATVQTPGVTRASSSVLKVRGVAPSCSKQVEGTGFVFAPERVLTNAHVVAGVRNPRVEINGGSLPARVVLFDPDRDVAVLWVQRLTRTPLGFAAGADNGDDAVVAGYPQDGPYTTTPARIRNRQNARAPNIYSNGTVTRDIYAIRAKVRPGNSGGPLLSAEGKVYGVVFAAATDDAETGYALTGEEVRSDATIGATATAPVGTRGCD
jgi:S1-C subfamily serine protease